MEVKANTANKAGTSQYVNYLDIKLIGIDNLPKDWFEGNSAVNGEAPSFANHPFRYEVRIDFPSNELLRHKEVKESNENLSQQHEEKEQPEKYTKRESGKETSAPAGVLPENQQEEQELHSSLSPSSLKCEAVQSFTFTHGRLLQPLPEYVQYIHHATYTPSTNKTIGYNGDHTNNNNNVDNASKVTYTLEGMHTNKNNNEKEEEDTDLYAELTSPFELPEELLKYTTEQDTHESTNYNYNKDKKTQQETKELVSSSSPSGKAAKHDTDDVDVVNSVNTPQLMWICNEFNDIVCTSAIHNTASSGASGSASGALVNVNDSVLSKRRRNRQQQQQSNVASSSISNNSVIMGQSNNTNNNGYVPSSTSPPPSHMNSNLSNFNLSNVTNATMNSSSNSGNNNMSGPLNVAAPILLPKRQPSPCVICIPLTAAQEEYLQYLLYKKIPLVLTLRRMLRPSLPPEWEDYNSFYYEAFIPINLTQFASPGSREIIEKASLVPCCVNEVMKEEKKKYELEREKEIMMLEVPPSSLEEEERQELEQGRKEENASKLKVMNEVSSQEYNTHYPLPHTSRNTQINNNFNTRSLSTSSASKDINTNTTSINLTLDNIPSQLNPMEIANFRAKAQSMSASSIPDEHITVYHNTNTTINTENKTHSHEAIHNVNISGGGTVVLSEHERNKRRQALRKNKNNIPVCLYEEVDLLRPHFTHPYVIHNTTAHVSLHLNKTLTKLACDRVRPPVTPIQLIPTRVYRSTPSQETSQKQNKTKISNHNAMESFRSSVKAMTWQLIADFKKCRSNHSDCEDNNINNKDELSSIKYEQEPHAWRRRFMEYFQSSGQLTQFKQMLQPQIMEIIHSTFGIHDIKTWDNSFTAQRNVSELVNELYVLLMDTVESVLNEVTTTTTNTGSSPSSLTPQINVHQQEGKSLEHLHTNSKCEERQINKINSYESNEIWLERALEAEMNSDDSWAASCHEAHITRCTEALSKETSTSPSSSNNNINDINDYDSRVKQKQNLLVHAYVEAASFYLRSSNRSCGYHNGVSGNKSKAEVCYREAIAVNPRIPITLIHYALFLMSYKRLDEAAVYIHGTLDILTDKHNNSKKKNEEKEIQLTDKEMCDKNEIQKLYEAALA